MTSRATQRSFGLRPVLLGAAAAALLGGCALGPRPTLTDERLVDDAAVEAVLDRLDKADDVTFTATYTVQPALADSTPAEVTVRATPERARVTFAVGGDVVVEYSDTEGEQRTCAAGLTECVAGFDQTRISNLAVTHAFWGTSAVDKLRADADRIQADATSDGPPQNVALPDLPFVCAHVPTGSSEVVYCALDAGPLAYYLGADVTITLTDFEATVDPAAFG